MNAVSRLILTLALASSCGQALASPYAGTGQYFVDPSGWNVGDTGSTYEAWDDVSALTSNLPDAGYTVNPLIGTDPVLNGNAPAFRVSSGNFYSFGGSYEIFADIYNHGTGGADGTHILIQTAATKNTYSAIPTSMEIVDLAGGTLAGGDNGSALVNAGLLAAGSVASSRGDVTYEVLLWEFFLPAHTVDFRVQWTQDDDSSFDQFRVDSYITPNALSATPFAFQQIPEPETVVITLIGLVSGLGASRIWKGSSLL